MNRAARLAGAALPLLVSLLPAQTRSFTLHASGLLLATRAAPMPFDRTLTEARLVQPMLMAGFRAGAFSVSAVLDFEGWTMPDGQLSPGSWGEGFNDRRHPHTYVHELMADAVVPLGGRGAVSLAAGKGFAPFGTDDPMSRPATHYTVNHHFSQVLERAVLIAGARTGPVTLEFGLFNGDEPTSPSDWPLIDGRFGDSWAARAFVAPARGVELQLSRARVRSPEHRRPPAGPLHEKWSASLRYERPTAAGRRYAMVEYARTSELDGFFVYHSWLGEAELRAGRHRPYLRLERTDRPEEERPFDPFRSQRPHFENTNLGISRWRVVTVGYGYSLARGARFSVEPLAEVAAAHVTMVTGGAVFTPQGHFGGNDLLTLNVGLRVGAGAAPHRLGRYGVLARPDGSAASHRHE